MARHHADMRVWRARVLGRIDRVDRAREKAEDARMTHEPADPVSDYEMAVQMRSYGGTFSRLLGELWFAADEVNRAKILATWPDLAAEYRDYVRLARERARQG